MITVYSYNIQNNLSALSLIVKHLKAEPPSICAIQEASKIRNRSSTLSLKALNGYVRRVSNNSYHIANKTVDKVIFVVSASLRVTYVKPIDSKNRFSSLFLQSKTYGQICIIGLHGYDCINYPLRGSKRDTYDRELANAIDTHANSRPTIIVGDFNCPPYYEGLCGVHGFFARRDKSELSKFAKSTNIIKRAYFNPTWQLLPEACPAGTFFFRDLFQTVNWHLLDQIVVSGELSSCVTNLRILDTLAKKSLINKAGGIKKAISDHLPLKAEINI
jgi:exonuclease III